MNLSARKTVQARRCPYCKSSHWKSAQLGRDSCFFLLSGFAQLRNFLLRCFTRLCCRALADSTGRSGFVRAGGSARVARAPPAVAGPLVPSDSYATSSTFRSTYLQPYMLFLCDHVDENSIDTLIKPIDVYFIKGVAPKPDQLPAELQLAAGSRGSGAGASSSAAAAKEPSYFVSTGVPRDCHSSRPPHDGIALRVGQCARLESNVAGHG